MTVKAEMRVQCNVSKEEKERDVIRPISAMNNTLDWRVGHHSLLNVKTKKYTETDLFFG